jgi:hypothetical protein
MEPKGELRQKRILCRLVSIHTLCCFNRRWEADLVDGFLLFPELAAVSMRVLV